jgi:hypothetical protein
MGIAARRIFLDFEIRVHGEKVFEVKWDKARGFKALRPWRLRATLRAWPAPIPM